MKTCRDVYEPQEDKLNMILKIKQAKAVSDISQMTDFVKGNYFVIFGPIRRP
jgi:hypothetical protein